MFQERYNRIVLPFFFIIDFILVLLIFIIKYLILDKTILLNIYLLFPPLLWSVISFYFKSFRVLRVNSYRGALKPTFFTSLVFSFFY